jgi:hypothetical protein
MLATMDAREMAEWRAYEKLEPFGEARADLRMGISTAATLNVNRRRGSQPIKPRDVMPDFDEQYRPRQTVAEMQAAMKGAIR